jgi:NADH dehydrogenase [ubiquinone] 1 alpha subcomplex assembly factor 1
MPLILLFLVLVNTPSYTINFGNNDENSWISLNDGVMGGRSQGDVSYTDVSLYFSGNVSFQNNGGFASVRSRFQFFDFSTFEKVSVTYRSSGQSLGLVFENNQRWYLPNYKAILPETRDKWQTIEIPLINLKEYQIGRPTGRSISKNQLEKIIRIGFITNDKKEGPFSAEFDKIVFL